jgi:dipeptidyl-peptidase-4
MFNKDLYPTVETFKYPKRREEFLVSLHIYDAASKATKEINLGKYNDFILPAWNGQMCISSAGVKSSSDNLIYCLLMERLERQK